MNKIKVSAPGKLHLLGEHAVVHNRPAILAAVDRRCFIELNVSGEGITVFSKNYNVELELNFKELINKFEKADEDWNKYDKTNDIPLLRAITKDPLDYPFIVIGQFIKYFNLTSLPGFSLSIDSQIPVGSGMGSSGALAVSIIGALFALLGKALDKEEINKIAYLCEQKKHGKPSGGDNSTSCFGGLVWFKKDEGLRPLEIALPEEVVRNFYIINTGIPSETTGEMVSLVRDLVDKSPESTNPILDSQEGLVHSLLPAFEKADHAQIIEIIRNGEGNLEKLGVVSNYVRGIIREIEKSGGAAKICGAGGTTKATGIILIYHPDLQNLQKVLESHQLPLEKTKLGVEGIRVDE